MIFTLLVNSSHKLARQKLFRIVELMETVTYELSMVDTIEKPPDKAAISGYL